MKKLAKIFALVVVCVLAVTALVACGGGAKPNTDYASAIENLEKNGYEVQAIKATDEGAELALGTFATMYGIKFEDMEQALMAMKGEELIQMLWCKTEEAAKTVEKSANTLAEAAGEEAGEAVIGRDGKVVWIATEAAIAATK